ncbi:MAG: HIT domain-containing protein [Alphaproteobacteria bacterium]|nr:HIT domain-containing protein [Alphaproteobacteria bacterium]
MYDFTQNAPIELQNGFWDAVRKTVDILGVNGNFRSVAHTGSGAGQSVFHFHLHIMSE